MNELSFNLRPPCTLRHFVPCFASFHRVKCHRSYAHLPQIIFLLKTNEKMIKVIENIHEI
ncbi:hypothetical protein HMPREF9420_1588 [Segatella salivae DSM 15606]|uniref:Uncharacterized protein n=1 Tax=Segatella salivae DSM 15606 TaxID=888832 RepID=E6MQ20_9BACT|nr:hypothetical protein HMPREF9420_1588 [Segatella salivae DSM 15606]